MLQWVIIIINHQRLAEFTSIAPTTSQHHANLTNLLILENCNIHAANNPFMLIYANSFGIHAFLYHPIYIYRIHPTLLFLSKKRQRVITARLNINWFCFNTLASDPTSLCILHNKHIHIVAYLFFLHSFERLT